MNDNIEFKKIAILDSFADTFRELLSGYPLEQRPRAALNTLINAVSGVDTFHRHARGKLVDGIALAEFASDREWLSSVARGLRSCLYPHFIIPYRCSLLTSDREHFDKGHIYVTFRERVFDAADGLSAVAAVGAVIGLILDDREFGFEDIRVAVCGASFALNFDRNGAIR